jgi:putative spermidine/putrescine transport system permease protein
MLNKFKLSSLWFQLAPAILLISVLFGASIIFGLAQSLGLLTGTDQQVVSFEAYRNIFNGQRTAGREFWSSLGFSLWIAAASTLLSAGGALVVAIFLSNNKGRFQQLDTLALNWNLAFPHLVWAIALLLFFSQSGLLARLAATIGVIQTPADFPVLVKDRIGIGIILDYVTKELPFLTLIVLAVLRAEAENLDVVAENLGASRWQRLRYVTIPQVLPALTAGSLIVFGFVFSSYEVPAVLGVRYPRMLPVLALDSFLNPDLNSRAEGMVISLTITAIVMIIAVLSLRGEGDNQQ